MQQLAVKQQVEQRRLDTEIERITRERDSELQKIERELDADIRRVQNFYKTMALFLPMLLPLALGLIVYTRRRARESEGISSDRRR